MDRQDGFLLCVAALIFVVCAQVFGPEWVLGIVLAAPITVFLIWLSKKLLAPGRADKKNPGLDRD